MATHDMGASQPMTCCMSQTEHIEPYTSTCSSTRSPSKTVSCPHHAADAAAAAAGLLGGHGGLSAGGAHLALLRLLLRLL